MGYQEPRLGHPLTAAYNPKSQLRLARGSERRKRLSGVSGSVVSPWTTWHNHSAGARAGKPSAGDCSAQEAQIKGQKKKIINQSYMQKWKANSTAVKTKFLPVLNPAHSDCCVPWSFPQLFRRPITASETSDTVTSVSISDFDFYPVFQLILLCYS